ncbi:hypothetical protein ACFQY5_35155 [Paeniroseomonas aquatica]|uniref:hypothetical protein n=1 Tax=Paeniroseomonas aquatica TaxID=373043 RepID=UPI00362137C0
MRLLAAALRGVEVRSRSAAGPAGRGIWTVRLLAVALCRVEVRRRTAGLGGRGVRVVRLLAAALRRVEVRTLRALFLLSGGLRQY